MMITMCLLVNVAAAAATASAAVECQLQTKPTVCVLGGDDAGTGAAWSSASLNVPTLLVRCFALRCCVLSHNGQSQCFGV